MAGKSPKGGTGRKAGTAPSKKGKPDPILTATNPQFIYIRVHTAHITGYLGSSSHIYLIKGSFHPLEGIPYFAGDTVDWIIKIARLLCEPLGLGRVYTHTSGSPDDWYNISRDHTWHEVVQGTELQPGIYEFEPSVSIVLSKISNRHNHSKTTLGSASNATSFRNLTFTRDTACIATGLKTSIVASHLIPKRLGTDGVQSIMERFVSTNAAVNAHHFDPRTGVTLFLAVDSWVDCFKAGFYHVENNTYQIHNFDQQPLTIIGSEPVPGYSNPYPPLHCYEVTLSANQDIPLPPTGVFNWHYLQCVITRFATQEYRDVPDINFYVYPFRTESDGDSSCSKDSEELLLNPPYPSYPFDRYWGKIWERREQEKRREEVQAWASGVTSED